MTRTKGCRTDAYPEGICVSYINLTLGPTNSTITSPCLDRKDEMALPSVHDKYDHTQQVEFADRTSVHENPKAEQHVDIVLKSDLDNLSQWQTAWRFRKVSLQVLESLH